MQKLLLAITLFLCFHCINLNAQQIVRSTIGAMGGSAKNETSLIQQTIGQPSATSFVGNPDGSAIRQGFHQPYLIETIKKDINVSVYPNPNDGNFAFEILEENSAPYQFQIIDQNGKLLQEGLATSKQKQEVRLGQVAQSIYFLKIFQGKQQSAFKINVIY
jgi:hypothetical protein